jgi:hypothetical protein
LIVSAAPPKTAFSIKGKSSVSCPHHDARFLVAHEFVAPESGRMLASMPNVGLLPRADRVNAMATWLQQNGINYDVDAGDDGIRSAWNKLKCQDLCTRCT